MDLVVRDILIISSCILYITLIGICSYYCHSTNKCCYRERYDDYEEI